MNKPFIIFLLLLFSSPVVFAQYDLPFGFEKSYDISVLDSLGNPLKNPWTGGLNSCQFGELDLDGDSIRDLVVFDRNGNRTLTYKNGGAPGEINYEFAPELSKLLPHFDDWVIFADYNMDGLNDIFTYSKGYAGIKVYKNTGDPSAMFTLVVSPYLKSFQGGGYVNVLVTYADYPAIFDIDNDGDLDLLTFWGLGSFVEFHLNESMERYGIADSLIFRKTENCWGRFAESDESNIIYLDTCFDWKNNLMNKSQSTFYSQIKPDSSALPVYPPSGGAGRSTSAVFSQIGAGGGAPANGLTPKSDPKHTGSTFMIFDENGDGLLDLLLGDVDYFSPALLTNGGSPDEALMVSHIFNFPEYDVPIDLVSFPVMSYLDVNNDGQKDMLVSPFDPSLVKAQTQNSVWLYKDDGVAGYPDFHLQNKAFLQDEMLDFGGGAVPVLFDYNNDGLMDIVVGNYGYLDTSYYGSGMNLYCIYRAQLALLENVGTANQPEYKLIDRNYADIPSYFPDDEKPFAAVPAFSDLDGDGDEDMLVGNSDGTLFYFQNVAASGQPANFQLIDYKYKNIDVGYYSAPQFFDLDGDGLKDLIIGKQNGTISWFENTGSLSNPEFSRITDSLGKVDVRNPNLTIFGYCIPHFYKDNEGEIHLFAGSEFGEIYYYDNINENLDGEFNLVMKNYLWIDEGLRTAVAIGNLDGDIYPDMIVGNYSGGLSWFRGKAAPPATISEKALNPLGIKIFPNPANGYLNIYVPEDGNIIIENMKLIDFSGKEIYTGFNEKVLKLTDLPEGIYLLQIIVKNPEVYQQEVFKIIIQH